MPDNVAITAGTGTPIATDEVTTRNGGTVAAEQVQRVKVGSGVDGTFNDATADTPIPVELQKAGLPSILNARTTNLAANEVFTGTAEDVTKFANAKVNVYSSHASATDGLSIQFSHNNVDWYWLDPYSIAALIGKTFSAPITHKWFRVVYTNGATATTTFVLDTLFYTGDKQASTHRPQDGRSNENDFIEMLSHLMGYNSGANTWERLRTSIANGLQVDVTRMPITAVTGTFFQATQPVSGTFFQATQPVSLGTNTPDVTDRAARLLGVVASIAGALPAGANAIGNLNELRAATLTVTVTAASGTAATLTLPAVAGQFHYITSLEVRLYSTAARVGAAAPILVTTTNISGTPSLTFDTAGAIGTSVAQQPFVSAMPVKSLTVNTATTIVAPIATAGIWRITATYFTAV